MESRVRGNPHARFGERGKGDVRSARTQRALPLLHDLLNQAQKMFYSPHK